MPENTHFNEETTAAQVVVTHANPVISLFDQVTRIKQRELRPTDAEI